MRRVIISSRQDRMLRESSAGHVGEDSCVDDSRVERRLTAVREKEVRSNFTDDISSYPVKEIADKLNSVSARIARKEKDIKPKLTEVCIRTVSQLFDIPTDDVSLRVEITDEIQPDRQFRVDPDTDEGFEYGSYSDIEREDSVIRKRKLLNAIVMGCSMRLAEKSKSVYLESVFDLDEELPHLYSMLSKINEYLLFRAKYRITDKVHFQSAYADVRIGDDLHASTVDVHACNFPSALVETINSLLQVVVSGSLTNEDELSDRILRKTDLVSLEPSNMKIGPAIWDLLIGDSSISSKDVPDYINMLSEIEPDRFCSIMNEVMYGTRRGKGLAAEMLASLGGTDGDAGYGEGDLVDKDYCQGIIEDDIEQQ